MPHHLPMPQHHRAQRRALAEYADIRRGVLGIASQIADDTADPAAVVAAAQPLLGWLADAQTRTDVRARWVALRQQWANRRSVDGDAVLCSPTQLVADARVLWAGVLIHTSTTDE